MALSYSFCAALHIRAFMTIFQNRHKSIDTYLTSCYAIYKKHTILLDGDMMQIETLYYLLAIEKSGSTRRAAEELNTSYQNVSRVLLQAEEELGQKLFLRSSKGMVPSEEGKLALISAKNMLKIYENLLEQLEYRKKNSFLEYNKKIAGRLDLVSSIITSNGFLNEFLIEFSAQYPNIQINLMEDDAYLADKNRSYHLYILPRTVKELQQHKELFFPLLEDRIVMFVKKDSSYDTQKTISLKRMMQFPLVLLSKNNWANSIFSYILNMHQLQPEHLFYTNSVIGFQKSVASGNYVGLTTDILSSKLISDRKNLFHKIPIRDKNIEIYHCLVIIDRDHLTPVEETFVRAIKETFHIS